MTSSYHGSEDLLLALRETEIPPDLLGDVERSLRVPQAGPYHREAPFMEGHLEEMRRSILFIDLVDGPFDYDLDVGVQVEMAAAIDWYGLHAAYQYMFLHDVDKTSCMTLVYTDGRKVAVTWEKWTTMFAGSTGEELSALCLKEGIQRISYYQEVDGQIRDHGRVTAERLAGRSDVPQVVVEAIRDQTLALAFGERDGVNIPLAERVFGERSEHAQAFFLAVNYADQMASHREGGEPDMGAFISMVESREAWANLRYVTKRLAEFDRLDTQKVARELGKLRKATDAFRNETADQAYSRIVGECTLPEVTEEAVRQALEPVIADGLPAEIVEVIVTEMVSSGKLSRETGKQLGRFNRLVRTALATLG